MPSLQSDDYHDQYAAIAQVDVLTSEPECIRKWREQQTQLLAEKDAEAEAEQEKWMAQAKDDLDEWYAKHEEHIAQMKETNR